MAPPPFQLLSSSTLEEEAPEEDFVEQATEAQADTFADGAEDGGNDAGGGDSPSTPPVQLNPLPGSRRPSLTNDGELLGDNETGGSNSIVPPLILLGIQLAIDLAGIEETTSVPLNLEIFPGCVAKRLEVEIAEGAFVSGTLVVESDYLSGIELTLAIDAAGNVSVQLQMEHEFLGLPTEIYAQVTEEGFAGKIDVLVPAGTAIVPGLKTTDGSLHFVFGNEEAILEGNIGVVTDDGLATGSAEVRVDWSNSNWSGNANLVSEPRTISVAPGVDVHLPEGFQVSASFGSEEGLVMEGSATVVPEVTLSSANGIEAGGTAELEANLGPQGLDVVLKKVRLAVTGGLNAPEMTEVLESQHLSTTVDAGALMTLWFEENSLNKVDLEFTAGLDSATRRIGRLTFAGQAVLNPFGFLGMLHAVTSASFTLFEGGVYTTSVLPGSQLFVSLDNSGISNVDASLGLEVSDQESALARMSVATSLPRGQGLSLSAQLELLRRLELSSVEEDGLGVSILPTSGLGATLESGTLTGIEGALSMEVADQEGDLLAGSVNGQIAVTDSGLSLQEGMAMASLLRSLKMDVGAGEVSVTEGAMLSVEIQGGKVVSLSGQVEAIYDDGNSEISISASIEYDPTQKIIRSLDANLATDNSYSLFSDKLVVSELEGGITIRNNEVVALGGHARLDAYIGDFTASGEADLTWSNDGEGSSFVGAGWLEFSWFQDEEEDKYLNGRIDATIDGEQFSLLGTVQVGLMKGLSGQATVAMDQEMDPEISASLSYNAVLMEASELWGMDFNLGIQVPLIPGLVALEAGILFGMAINTRPLMVFGTVGVESWKPLSGGFPDFFAELSASWGIDIEAKLMAYLELILGIDGLLHLTGGIRAGIGLNIPIELAPRIALHGGEDGVWGTMGIDLAINPILKLLVEAYMKWGVLGLWDGEKVWDLVDQELGNMGAINWSGSFAFGDKEEPAGEAPAVETQTLQPQGAPIPTPEGLNNESSLGYNNNEQEPESEVGLTGLTDGLETPTQQEEEGKVAGTGLGGELAKVGEYAQGVAAVADLIKVLADGFQSFIKGGPIGLLIWLLFKKPSKDEINEKRDAVESFRTQLMDENLIEEGTTISNMLGILSGSYSIWIIFDKSKPYRDMVDQGKHEEAILEDRAKILEGMIKGWTGEKDESRILKVLQYTLSNEGTAGVREMTELVGGPKRVRDQYESFLGQDRDERRELDRIFTASYGSNWEDNPDVSDRPTYTAEEGAFVKRTGRTWEQLAEEAFGHSSYVVYLLNYPYNVGQMSSETAYNDYQQNNNNNNNSGGGGGPLVLDDFEDDMFDFGNNNNTYNGPPVPQFQARIPTKGEIVEMHESGLWQERFPVPGVIEHAHWFENYYMIALFAYGDAGYADALKAHNPMVPEVLEGVSITLPSADQLGPPWIEVAPTAIGSTGLQVWVSSDSDRNPEMWMGSPDRLVTELAEEAMAYDEGQTAGQELMRVATFAEDATQLDAENAVKVAEGLIDFILANNFGGEVVGTAWEDANPGDTVRLTADEIKSVAKVVYGHEERAAWIIAHNPNPGGGQVAAAKSTEDSKQMMELAPAGGSGGKLSYILPTWSEMNALDPLPVVQRGIAPQSSIEALDGDTWSMLAQKAYGNWELAVKLAEYSENTGKTLSEGTVVVIPKRSDLQTLEMAAVDRVAVTDGPGVGGQEPIPGDLTSVAVGQVRTTSDGETQEPEVDNRVFEPGSTVVAKAGDTWSAIAVATYDDFSLFVRLSNHPSNVPYKTLPDGAEIYLPTLDELMEVPEFGLGLSPTGNPLLTEMLRVPTQDELHHVWVEDRSGEGEEVEGVWMMASTPMLLEPEARKWEAESEDNSTVNDAAAEIIALAEQGEDSKDQIQDAEVPVRTVVEEGLYEASENTTTTTNAELTEAQLAAAIAYNEGQSMDRVSIRLLQDTLGVGGSGEFDVDTIRALAVFSNTRRLNTLNGQLTVAQQNDALRDEIINRVGPPTDAEVELLNTDTGAIITDLEGQIADTRANFNATDGHLTRALFDVLFVQMVEADLQNQAAILAMDYVNVNQNMFVTVELDSEATVDWRIEVPFSNMTLSSDATEGAVLTDAPNQMKKVFLSEASFASVTALETSLNAVNQITYQTSGNATTQGTPVNANLVTLTATQLTAAESHNGFLFDQARSVNIIQSFLRASTTGTMDAATCQAISNYQQNNTITRTDGRLDHATLDHIVRAMITADERDAVLQVAVDFYNLGELAEDVILRADATVEGDPAVDEEMGGISSVRFGNDAFNDGLNGVGEALDTALGNGVSMNDEALDVMLAGTTAERQTALWSNPDQNNEDGLVTFVRENFPSEEDLGRFLARTDVTDAEKILGIGLIQVEIGRLEWLMGVLYHGGNNQSWENLATVNNNRGTFVNHFKDEVGNTPNGSPWCTMFSGYLKRMTGFEDDLSSGGPRIFNSGMRLDYWATEGRNLLTGVDDFSDPSDFQDYSGDSIDRADWITLRQNVVGEPVQQDKEQEIDDFFADRITPQAGDIVIMNTNTTTNNYSGTSSHTVTVESYDDYTISTIEGNRGQRLMGTEMDLRTTQDVQRMICLVRIGVEFYTENDVPAPQEGEEQVEVSAEDILNPLRHMVRNLQLMADHRNYIGDNTAGASVADMSAAAGNGTH